MAEYQSFKPYPAYADPSAVRFSSSPFQPFAAAVYAAVVVWG